MPIFNTEVTETINITENGQYDVARYTSANVNIPGAYGVLMEKLGSYIYPIAPFIDLTDIDSLYGPNLSYSYYNSQNLEEVDLKDLRYVGEDALKGVCWNCPFLTSVTGNSLEVIDNNGMIDAFKQCEELETVDFPVLSDVRYMGLFEAFYGCTNLTSITFDSLETLGQHALEKTFGYSGLTYLSFPVLNSLDGTSLDDMLVGVNGCTVHFPAAIESMFQDWSYLEDGFGGTNTTILFDL